MNLQDAEVPLREDCECQTGGCRLKSGTEPRRLLLQGHERSSFQVSLDLTSENSSTRLNLRIRNVKVCSVIYSRQGWR
jgi:hypothetical protein